jgi:hypothetical protein
LVATQGEIGDHIERALHKRFEVRVGVLVLNGSQPCHGVVALDLSGVPEYKHPVLIDEATKEALLLWPPGVSMSVRTIPAFR